MKSKLYFFIVCVFIITTNQAQDFSGFRTGNYTGVNGVFFNPANIVDSRFRFDINLFSLSANAGNNQATFSLKNISNSFNSDSLSNKIFGANAGTSSALVSTDFHGPSFMFNTGKKMSFAVTTRARVMANVTDMDGKLISKLQEDFRRDPNLPYTISSNNNMRFNANAWTEYGLSVARVISDEGKHFFKAGLSLKYLAGAGNAFITIDNFKGTLNEDQTRSDVYLNNTTGRIATGFGGIRISDIQTGDITEMESTGFGSDIGFVYEYRPENNNLGKRNLNKYKFKVSAALLDIGSVTYDKDINRSGAYNLDITGTERLYFSEIADVDIDDFKSFFNSRPQYFTPDNSNTETSYKVSLPSTLQLDIDYHLYKGFYVSLATQLPLSNSDSKPFNSNYYSSFTLTPRYEGKRLGFYIPLSSNSLTGFNAGACLRLGPTFIGSGSGLSALLGDSKQADVFVGFRFGSLW